jgi:hypothetical protein
VQPILEIVDRVVVTPIEHVGAQQVAGVSCAEKCAARVEAVMPRK